MRKPESPVYEDAVEAGIEAASDAVSNLPMGQQKWDKKEYTIAKTAARAAVAYMAKRLIAGKFYA